jgi:hypothetical protein
MLEQAVILRFGSRIATAEQAAATERPVAQGERDRQQ